MPPPVPLNFERHERYEKMARDKARIVCVSLSELEAREALEVCERSGYTLEAALVEGLTDWICRMTRADREVEV